MVAAGRSQGWTKRQLLSDYTSLLHRKGMMPWWRTLTGTCGFGREIAYPVVGKTAAAEPITDTEGRSHMSAQHRDYETELAALHEQDVEAVGAAVVRVHPDTHVEQLTV